MGNVSHEIVIDKEDIGPGVFEGLNLFLYFGDRSHSVGLSVKGSDRTELAVKRAPPCRLDEVVKEISLPGEEASSRDREVVEVRSFLLTVKGKKVPSLGIL